MKILNKFNQKVIYECEECLTIKDLVERASDNKIDLECANLEYANLRGANLRGVELVDSKLQGADLEGANLSYASLSYSNLSGANLNYANLSDANIQYVDLNGADLQGANLSGADFRGVKGNAKEIKTIQSDYYTINIIENSKIINIGFKTYTYDEWFSFLDNDILKMNGKIDLYFWNKWKPILMNIVEYKENI